MTVYQRKCTQPLKWLFALVIFVLAMTVTFSDVYGIDKNTTANSGGGNTVGDKSDDSNGGLTTGNDNPAPTAVPEPSTFILLASGLGALYAVRRIRNRNK